MNPIFRYDIAAFNDPRVILITDHVGKRSECPRLSYVVIPTPSWARSLSEKE